MDYFTSSEAIPGPRLGNNPQDGVTFEVRIIIPQAVNGGSRICLALGISGFDSSWLWRRERWRPLRFRGSVHVGFRLPLSMPTDKLQSFNDRGKEKRK